MHQVEQFNPQLRQSLAGDGSTLIVEALSTLNHCRRRRNDGLWAHPERVLDAEARAATSGFARMPAAVVDRVVSEVGRDLANGQWDRRHGFLRGVETFDVGLRLIVAR